MSKINETLADISRIEKAAGTQVEPPKFDAESVKKFAEASEIYKSALETVEKAQSEEVMKTTAGRSVAIMRASMLALEGAMAIIWDANSLDDAAKSQVQNAISLLGGLMSGDVAKSDQSDDDAPEANASTETPSEPEPTAKGDTPGDAAVEAAAGEKNTPEGHEEGNGAPANPDDVVWPKDLNSKSFRENQKPEENKPTWGTDKESSPAS